MAKKRSPSFLSRKKILSEEEYDEYQTIKKKLQESKYKKELQDLRSKEKRSSYSKTKSGRFGSTLSKGLAIAKRTGGVSTALYRKKSYTQGKVGRPKGSVKYVDPKTGQPIGVYEYRKILSSRLRRERAESLRSASVTPQQERALQIIERRRSMQSMNPEGRVIPSTEGTVYLNDIMNEIDDATNIVS